MASTTLSGEPALVIAHRGASGSFPEHSRAAYAAAIASGADYLELDLVMSRDGHLIVRHENELGRTTDVAQHPAFRARHTRKIIDGTPVTGWFAEDFSLDELRDLRVREPMPDLRPDSALHDGLWPILTFDDVLEMVAGDAATGNRRTGLYFEPKHPSYFAAIGLPFDDLLLRTLENAGYRARHDMVHIQSFEIAFLQRMRTQTRLPLTQLVADGQPHDAALAGAATTYDTMMTPAGLKRIAGYADGIGPARDRIVPRGSDGRSAAPSGLIAAAHEAGLFVHGWTFRNENAFLPLELRRGDAPATHGDAIAEYRQFQGLGIDGVFTDFPATALAARVAAATGDRM